MATEKEDKGIDITNQAEMQQAMGDDLFKDDSTVPTSNWFDFKNVGDNIQGVLIMEPYEKEGNYGTQTIYVVQTASGDEFNVALKNTTHRMNIQQLKKADVGDVVAFRLKELVDTGKGNPAKSIEVRIRHMMKD